MTFPLKVKQIGTLVGIMLLGGIGGVLLDHAFLPWLAAQRGLNQVDFLRRASGNVTVINKTEQVTVREDDSFGSIVSQPATAVVTLIPKRVPIVGHTLVKSMDPGLLTGVLLTNDGVIATYQESWTQQETALTFTALLFDGSYHDARFIGWDSLTNMVFFRIDVTDAPAIALANSDDALAGKKLIALSYAAEPHQNRFALGTLESIDTTFNLSGKTVASTEKWEGTFESNFSDTTRFVGGPVIQYNGEMLGMVGSLSLDNVIDTFIIPAKAVRQSLDFVLTENAKKRPVFGVYYVSITQAYAIAHQLPLAEGALIYSPSGRTGLSVIAGGPADKAGLQANDIITAVNDTQITLTHPLSVVLAQYVSGDTLTVTVNRSGNTMSIPVTLQ